MTSLKSGASPQPCAPQAQPPGTPGVFAQSNGGTTFTLAIDACTWTLTATGQAGSPITGTWTYSAALAQVSFTETVGLCGPVTGTYGWALSGNSLRMTAVSDSCAARSDEFAGYTWMRAG